MAPIGHPHEVCVSRLTTLLVRKAADRAIVWPRNNSIRLPGNSRPEPDVTLLRWRDDYYAARRPAPEDVLLIIEVAETSLKYEREVKGRLYAQAGIPEYWIVNLRDAVIEVYSRPVEGAFQDVKKAGHGETLALPSQLRDDDKINISDILGG